MKQRDQENPDDSMTIRQPLVDTAMDERPDP
jgi:hypothetical protein